METITCSVTLHNAVYPPREPQVGDFVVLKNGFFGPVIRKSGDGFEIAPINEIPDDSYPASVEDVVWVAPNYIRVKVEFLEKDFPPESSYSLKELDQITNDDEEL
jgi:hypothetical protein